MTTHMKLITLAAAGFGICAPAMAQQASITLMNSDVAYCYKQDASWTINKTNDAPNGVSGSGGNILSGSNVNWTIAVNRGANSPTQLCAVGTVIVQNSGTAPATIGNIVVDVQRSVNSGGTKWKAIFADVADAHSGDLAASDKVVAGAMASQTDYSAVATVSGAVGTFNENAYSGQLEFTDNSNTVWSISPQQTIPVGGSVTLLFKATFFTDGFAPALVPGENLRTEVLVSFGNAGARGGSGATAPNVDINGDGNTNPDEANVRTVPTRITKQLPALQVCNDTVTITDNFSTSDTSAVNVTSDGIGAGKLTSTSFSYLVSGTVTGDGIVSNTASLDGTDSTVDLLGGALAGGYTLPCCAAAHLQSTSSVTVFTNVPVAIPTHCSYSHNEYLHNGGGNGILESNYKGSFPAGLTIGGTLTAFWDKNQEDLVTPAHGPAYRVFESWLNGGGPSGALTGNTSNATSTGGGNLAKEIATLTVNVNLIGVGVAPFAGGYSGIGALVYHPNQASDSFAGMTVTQILAAANAILGGGPMPSDYTYNSLNSLLAQINQSWTGCHSNAIVNSKQLTEN
jgi:hypothetical protein